VPNLVKPRELGFEPKTAVHVTLVPASIVCSETGGQVRALSSVLSRDLDLISKLTTDTLAWSNRVRQDQGPKVPNVCTAARSRSFFFYLEL
jgi:hypothetical protein